MASAWSKPTRHTQHYCNVCPKGSIQGLAKAKPHTNLLYQRRALHVNIAFTVHLYGSVAWSYILRPEDVGSPVTMHALYT